MRGRSGPQGKGQELWEEPRFATTDIRHRMEPRLVLAAGRQLLWAMETQTVRAVECKGLVSIDWLAKHLNREPLMLLRAAAHHPRLFRIAETEDQQQGIGLVEGVRGRAGERRAAGERRLRARSQ